MEKTLNVYQWGKKKQKAARQLYLSRSLQVEHPRKKQITLSHKPLRKTKKKVNHSAKKKKNNGGNPVGK